MQKSNPPHFYHAETINDVARIYEVTPHYVRLVIRGERNNPTIKVMYETLVFGKNKLLEAVRVMVKID